MAETHYIMYLDGSYGLASYNSFSSLINMLSLPLTIIVEFMLYVKYKKKDYCSNDVVLQCLIVGTIVNNLFVNCVLWGRLTCYSTMLILICAPNFMETLKLKYKMTMWGLIWSVFVFKTYKYLIWQQSPYAVGSIIYPYTFFN